MELEAVLNLFDSLWFFPKTSVNQSESAPFSNPSPQNSENISIPHIKGQLSTISRSKSDDLTYLSSSPDSVLKTHLQTVLSDREMCIEIPKPPPLQKQIENVNKKKKRFSKSLSELEFEEVKGFMDLGFVFSEEDKDSSLVEIIPGLQRFGQESSSNCDHHRGIDEERRPYLSEAWEILKYREREESALMKWRVPAVSNEIDMKDSLKWWAHSVASAVR